MAAGGRLKVKSPTQGATATYTIANLCPGIATGTGYFNPGSIHTANMTGLTPATRYYYIYGSDVSSLSLSALATMLQKIKLAGAVDVSLWGHARPSFQSSHMLQNPSILLRKSVGSTQAGRTSGVAGVRLPNLDTSSPHHASMSNGVTPYASSSRSVPRMHGLCWERGVLC